MLKHQPYIEAAEAIAGLAPFLDHPKVFLCNSGAEAVDGAIKLARRTTGRPGHRRLPARVPRPHDGRHHAHHGQGDLPGGLRAAAAGRAHRAVLHPDAAAPTTRRGRRGAGRASTRSSRRTPARVAAMVVEPVLGEGGYIVPPDRVARRACGERCADHGILLVFDEVQCGFGRTGRPFAAETFGVAPDVLLFAKGVASGLPLAGIMAGADADGPLAERHPRLDLRRQPGVVRGRGGHHRGARATRACYERAVALGDRARPTCGPLAAPTPSSRCAASAP